MYTHFKPNSVFKIFSNYGKFISKLSEIMAKPKQTDIRWATGESSECPIRRYVLHQKQ